MGEDGVEIQETQPVPNLKAELKPTFDPRFSTLGHGTGTEAAKQALAEGLKAKVPYLDSTTIPLFDYSRTYDEQVDETINKLEHWPHLDSKAIVFVMIPNPEEGQAGGRMYFDSVFEELPEKNTGYNNQYVLPNSYIRGYFDVEKKQFIENPHFKPEKPTMKLAEAGKPPAGRVKEPIKQVTLEQTNDSSGKPPNLW